MVVVVVLDRVLIVRGIVVVVLGRAVVVVVVSVSWGSTVVVSSKTTL